MSIVKLILDPKCYWSHVPSRALYNLHHYYESIPICLIRTRYTEYLYICRRPVGFYLETCSIDVYVVSASATLLFEKLYLTEGESFNQWVQS